MKERHLKLALKWLGIRRDHSPFSGQSLRLVILISSYNLLSFNGAVSTG